MSPTAEGYPVDEHFHPAYNPWDQRLCAVPDRDMFQAIADGAASVVTDRIATFTETGISWSPAATSRPTSSSPRRV